MEDALSTPTTTPMPNFRRGAAAAEEAVQEAKKRSGSTYSKREFFKIEKAGGQEIIRFLTDYESHPGPDGQPSGGMLSIMQYSFLPTKKAPEGWKGTWPANMGAVARSDSQFEGMFADDFIKDHMRKPEGKPYFPTVRGWAYACYRDEIRGADGSLIGFKDRIQTVSKPDGKGGSIEVEQKAVCIVNMGMKNFFNAIIPTARLYGTWLDRDFLVTRHGENLETSYTVTNLEQSAGADGQLHDLRNPAIAATYGAGDYCPSEAHFHPLLEDVIAGMASDDYYARWFDTRVEWKPDRTNDSENPDEGVATKPQVDAQTQDQLEAMRARVMGYGPNEEIQQSVVQPETSVPVPPADPSASGGHPLMNVG
jgi:hypothetical protein